MSMDDSYPLWFSFVIFIVGIAISTLASLINVAVSEANRNQIRALAESGDKKATRINRYLSSYKRIDLTGITINVLVIACISKLSIFPLVNRGISYLFTIEKTQEISKFFLNNIWIVYLAYLLFFTLVFLVFAIFIPREVARNNPENIALTFSWILPILWVSFYFITGIVRIVSNVFLKLWKQSPATWKEEFSEEDVISMLELGQDTGAIKEEGKKMINSIFAFDDKLAYEIMTPRTDVFSIDLEDEPKEYIDELMEMKYSRIPVYEEDSDNIVGILNIKDYLMEARLKGFDNILIGEILRPAFFVPETKNIDSLFFELQKQKQHIAILIDEYGGFSGIVTMEDIIEEVMGDIDDEYDEILGEIKQVGKEEYTIDGNIGIDYINEEIGTSFESETSETIGGLIIDTLGEIPEENSDNKITVDVGEYTFEILSVKDRRVEKVKMKKRKDNFEDKE